MIFYSDKLKFYRKKERLSTNELCKLLEIGRTTLWKWENSKKIPTEANIRLLSHVLKVSVNDLSDLEDKAKSDNILSSNVVDSWLSLVDDDERKRILQEEEFINKIKHQQHELRQATTVVKALLTSMHSLFYVKDTNLKYITANTAFLDNISFQQNYRVIDKDDTAFFPAKEAKINHAQDLEVLNSGTPILKYEGFIPGSRKKKWGLISKTPIVDSLGKIAGIVCTMVDITERLKTEEIRKLLEETLNNSQDVVWLRQPPPSNKLIYVSESIASLSGYPPENFFETYDFWIENCVHKDDRALQREYRDNKSWPHFRKYRIVKPDGEIRWIESNIFYKNFIDQNCVGCIDIDITDKVKAREDKELNFVLWVKEGRKKVALKMKQKGLPSDLITEVAELSLQEIEEL